MNIFFHLSRTSFVGTGLFLLLYHIKEWIEGIFLKDKKRKQKDLLELRGEAKEKESKQASSWILVPLHVSEPLGHITSVRVKEISSKIWRGRIQKRGSCSFLSMYSPRKLQCIKEAPISKGLNVVGQSRQRLGLRCPS